VGEDVGALEGLVEEAEDVIDDEDALFGGLGARGVWEEGLDVGLATRWFGGVYRSLGHRLQCSLLWVSSLCSRRQEYCSMPATVLILRTCSRLDSW
jgi:hypothetical protein